MTQCIDRTPSINFNFEDTSKRKQTNSIFDLSCTNVKADMKVLSAVKPSPLQYRQGPSNWKRIAKLKTQQFFQEFDKNFMVLYQEERKPVELGETAKTLELRQGQLQNEQENVSKFSISAEVCPPTIFSLKEDNQSGLSLQSKKVSSKQKNSPIPAFQIKKRTVFKSKKTIQQTSQFKITTKKIYNKSTIQDYVRQNNCKVDQSKRQKGMYLSLKVWKDIMIDNQKKTKSNIIHSQYPSLRDNMRSTLQSKTLDYWRKQLQRKGQTTVRRQNIFRRTSCQ